MRHLRAALLICLILLPSALFSQYYNTGQDPASLKWLQIKTGRFKVIYPESYGTAGIEFAKSLNKAYSGLISLYPEKKFNIPVIIHNNSIQSNGYVAWAPSRMEIYPTPEQNSIPLDANTQLAIHELTHVLQLESLNRGFTKAMSFIAGQQFPGAVSSLLPLWFLEGDAVFTETWLTHSGRGRSPDFQKKLKALLVEKNNIYSYDKIVSGSFRDFVPDHYETGYQMMAWSYGRYGAELWKNALNLTAGAPFIINPVNFSLRRSASLTKRRLFNETFDTLRTIWKNEVLGSARKSYEILNPEKGNHYINYYSPVLAGSDSIIAIKTSLSYPPSFVLIRPSLKTEEKIHVPGYCYPYFLSYGKGKLVWVEMHTDPRWENRAWSVIKIMDMKTGNVGQLKNKTRYMSASISPDGNIIAATENTTSNINRLVILDAWNGYILYSAEAPENASLQRPQWDESGKAVTVIHLTEKGEGVLKFSLAEKAWQPLIEAGPDDLQSAFLRNDSLFFVSSVSGTNNLYLLTQKRPPVPLTRSRFGISDPDIKGYFMLFSDYTSSGNNISYTTLPSEIADTDSDKGESSFLISRVEKQPQENPEVTDNVYAPSPYRKWQHLFRLHSWMPFYADIEKIQEDPTEISPGLTLFSQNNLSTLESSVGYEYSQKRHKYHASVKWMGWYPVIESRIDYGNSLYIEKFREDIADPADVFNGYEWTNNVYFPLSFRGGRFTKYLYLSGSSTLRNDYIYLKSRGIYDNLQNQLTGRIIFSVYQRSALRDIYPRLALTLDLSYSDYPFDRDIYGDILTARTSFFIPGLLKNNSIRLRLEAEKQNPEKFILGNRASFARGYIGARTFNDDAWFHNIISQELQTVSADYFMPLVYPDLNIPGILFLSRIRADMFFDYTRGFNNYVFISDINEQGVREIKMENHDYREVFSSFGVQLMADYYLFRIPFMISSGVETAWREPGGYPYIKLLFSVDLFGMNIGKRKTRGLI